MHFSNICAKFYFCSGPFFGLFALPGPTCVAGANTKFRIRSSVANTNPVNRRLGFGVESALKFYIIFLDRPETRITGFFVKMRKTRFVLGVINYGLWLVNYGAVFPEWSIFFRVYLYGTFHVPKRMPTTSSDVRDHFCGMYFTPRCNNDEKF